MKKEEKIIYYEDELTDEFAGDHIIPKRIDGSYCYERENWKGRLGHLFWYHMVAIPLAHCYMKLYFHHKMVNRSVLEQTKGKGYFVYGNHTHFLGDALIPTLANRPVDVSVIVHPNNVSMPVLGRITPSLGALPLPDDKKATRNFMHAIDSVMKKEQCLMIYPEAHIWPYYTKIRPFTENSFRYPVQYHAPVYALTNTYQKRKFVKRPRIVTYLDGPFYPREGISSREQKQILRDQVYESMRKRAENNSVTMIRYEKKG